MNALNMSSELAATFHKPQGVVGNFIGLPLRISQATGDSEPRSHELFQKTQKVRPKPDLVFVRPPGLEPGT